MNDIVINKIQSIQRCIARARQEFHSDPEGFAANLTVQDAAILNVLRACEQAIDLANHVIRLGQMGIPNSSAESFDLLAARQVISAELAGKLRRMTGFRNIATHEYQRLNVDIVRAIIVSGLDDLVTFGDDVRRFVERP